MYKSEVKLFGDAILEGISYRYEKEMSENGENSSCRESHRILMLDIISKSNAEQKNSAKKRLIAILVAAALLLTGCTAYVFRNEIGSFVEYVFHDHVDLDISNGSSNSIAEIQKAYVPTYIPEEYTLVDGMMGSLIVRYIYENASGERIVFDQGVRDVTSIGIHNDGSEAEIFEHNGLEIYFRSAGERDNYIWYDEYYVMSLLIPKSVPREEVFKMIENIE